MAENNPYHLFIRPLERLAVRYMVTGSVASMVYGEPRMTRDLDIVVALPPAAIARFPEVFPMEDFYLPPMDEMRRQSARDLRGQFNIIHHRTSFKADLYLLGRDEMNAWGLSRARRVDLDGEPLMVAPAESVILSKLEFFREGGSERHLRDIRGMLDVTPELPYRAELEQFIAERGLQAQWQMAQAFAR